MPGLRHFKKYLFIWLLWVLSAVHGLSYSVACESLVPSLGMELTSPALQGNGFLTTEPPGKPWGETF